MEAARRRCRIAKGRKHGPLGTCSRNSSKDQKTDLERRKISRLARERDRAISLGHERKRERQAALARRDFDATKVAAMRQNLNTASSSLAKRFSNGRYRCPYYHGPSLIQTCATAACTYGCTVIYPRTGARVLWLSGPEEVKEQRFVLQYATERRHDIGESTDACVVARRLAAILESCQQTSHCALNP